MFRWCTDRMKIAPTSNYIRTQISQSGEVVLLLGVRRAESANRAVTMNRHRNVAGTRLNPHDDMKGCMVFRPIMEMTTDDVWLLLLQRKPPWGGSHSELVTVAGPFTVEARQEILARLLAVQKEVDMTLISEDEIARIRTMWADDAVEEAKRHLLQREKLRSREQA